MPSGNFFSRLLGRGRSSAPANGSAAPRAEAPPHPFRLDYVHSGAALVLEPSPDGELLALAGAGPVNRERKQFRRYKEHFDTVVESDVAVLDSPDLLGADGGPGTEGWRSFGGHTGPVRRVVWEGGSVWSCGSDRRVRRVSLEIGGALSDHQLHVDAVLGLMPRVPGTDNLGATISSDRTLKLWDRDSGREKAHEFISPAIILSALLLPEGGPDGAPAYLATDQRCEMIGRFGAEKFEKLAPLKFDEPVYRLSAASDGSVWAGHRLGDVSRVSIDADSGKLVESDRREVFDGCRPLALREFERAGKKWLACGSLRGEVALVPADGSGGEARFLPEPLLAWATALAWWKGRLLAGDSHGHLYDLTPWLDEAAEA